MSEVEALNNKIGQLLSGMNAEEIVEVLTSSEPSLLARSHQQNQNQVQQQRES